MKITIDYENEKEKFTKTGGNDTLGAKNV